MNALLKFDEILAILEELNFEVSKEVRNPSLVLKTAKPIITMTSDTEGKSKQYSIKAKHESRVVNYLAALEIIDLFGEDNSFLLVNNPYNFYGYSGLITPELWIDVLKEKE